MKSAYRLAYSYKGSAGALKLSLTRHIALVLFRTMPFVTIALNCESGIEPIHHQIDPFAGKLDLWADCKLAPQQLQRDVNLEPALVGFGLVSSPPGSSGLPFELVQIFGEGIERSVSWIVKEAEQFPAQGLGAEIVLPHAVKQPHLVPRGSFIRLRESQESRSGVLLKSLVRATQLEMPSP